MIVESPTNAHGKMEVDESHQAARVSLRSYDWHAPGNTHIGGHYRTLISTGLTTGIAAAAAILSLRWTNADRALLLNRIRAWATIETAFTTAQRIALDLVRVNNFTAADTGGTLIDLGDTVRKERMHMRNSSITNLRIATTGALGAGTGSEEAHASGGLVFAGLTNVVGAMAGGELFNVLAGQEHPFMLGSLEGFRIRNRVAQGAVGVVTFDLELDWTEIPTSLLGA